MPHSQALQNLFAGFAPFVVFQNPLEEISVDQWLKKTRYVINARLIFYGRDCRTTVK